MSLKGLRVRCKWTNVVQITIMFSTSFEWEWALENNIEKRLNKALHGFQIQAFEYKWLGMCLKGVIV